MKNFPKNGFYYHYKHNPIESVNNYAYEVLGVSKHTETGEFLVVYRPLYKSDASDGADSWTRPVEMFMETVEKNDLVLKRFTLVENQEIIERLKRF